MLTVVMKSFVLLDFTTTGIPAAFSTCVLRIFLSRFYIYNNIIVVIATVTPTLMQSTTSIFSSPDHHAQSPNSMCPLQFPCKLSIIEPKFWIRKKKLSICHPRSFDREVSQVTTFWFPILRGGKILFDKIRKDDA